MAHRPRTRAGADVSAGSGHFRCSACDSLVGPLASRRLRGDVLQGATGRANRATAAGPLQVRTRERPICGSSGQRGPEIGLRSRTSGANGSPTDPRRPPDRERPMGPDSSRAGPQISARSTQQAVRTEQVPGHRDGRSLLPQQPAVRPSANEVRTPFRSPGHIHTGSPREAHDFPREAHDPVATGCQISARSSGNRPSEPNRCPSIVMVAH